MKSLLQDIRYGVRILLRNPGFTATAVLTLALGIGANTVVFCVARALLFPPLPYRDSAGILSLVQWHRVNGGWASSIPDFLDWKARNHVFSQMAASSYGWATVSGGTEPEEVDTAYVSDDFFALMGVAPLAGRTFLPEEYRPGAERVMVLGYGLWQRQFGGRQDALGRQLVLGGESYTVVGVMPPGFESTIFTKAFLPLAARRDSVITDRQNRRAGVFARLKPGVTLAQARREMEVIADNLSREYPVSNTDFTVDIVPWRERMTSRFHSMVGLLMGAVAFVLLISCANVANLLMARAAARQKEIAVRVAIGAARTRLIRQLLTESLLLAMLGGLAGVLLAFWSIPLLNGFYSFARPISLDAGILGAVTALAGVAALLFGSIPALLLARLDQHEILKDKIPQTRGAHGHRFRGILVIGETALSVVLLYGAALLLHSLIRYESLDKGFDARNVLNLVVNLYRDRYPRGYQVLDFSTNVLAHLERMPGKDSAAVTAPVALKSGQGTWGIMRAGWQPALGSAAPVIDSLAVSSDYFRVMRIQLLRGRAFTPQEAEQGAEAVILSEKLARQLWPREDPVGQTVKLETAGSDLPWLTVVGVAREARGHSFPSAAVEALSVYIPLGLMRVEEGRFSSVGGNRDGRFTPLRFYVRTAGDPMNQIASARAAVLEVDKRQPVFLIRTMEDKLYQEGSPRRALAVLVGVFAFVALLLASVGTYGVIAYSVSERRSEIGIRMALGAQHRDVVSLVLKQGMRILMIGLPLGLAGAFLLSGVLQNQLFGVSAADPLTVAGVGVVLGGDVLLASYFPARRAVKVDPLAALRCE